MNRFLLLTLTLFSCLINVRAQYENTTWMQRMGHGKDSVMNMESQMQWTAYVSANASIAVKDTAVLEDRTWDDKAYRAWYRLITKAPYSQFSLYASGNAGDMLRYLIRREPDRAVQLIYFQDLMEMCELRIKNLDAINSIPDFGPDKKSTLGDVKSWKAHYYFTEGKRIPATVYSKSEAYKYFVEAMDEVRAQKDIAGTEVEPYLVAEYFAACFDLYDSDKEKYLEQYLQDYLDLTSTCRRLYETSASITDPDEAEQQFNRYYKPFIDMQTAFYNSGVNSRKHLEAHFTKQYESHSKDYAYLNKALALMVQFHCVPKTDTLSICDKYARAAYEEESSLNYYAALAYGLSKKRESDEVVGDPDLRIRLREEMMAAFLLAEKKATQSQDKAEVAYNIARALDEPLDPMFTDDLSEIEKWKSNLAGAAEYYNKSIDLAPDKYSVASTYWLGKLNSNVARVYYDYIRNNKIQDIATHEDMLDYCQQAVMNCNNATSEANRCTSARIYEQGGYNMMSFLAWAPTTAQNSNQYLSWCSNRLKQIKAPKGGGGSVDPEADPTHRAFHDYLRRKAAEESFWQNKEVKKKCKFCNRMVG